MHHWLHHVSTSRNFCLLSRLHFLAGTSGKSQERKTIAYARVLQCSVEQHNLPRKDQPRPLPKSMIELRVEVKFYLSFMDEEVFQGVDLPEEDRDKPLASTLVADTLGATAAEKTLPTQKVSPAYAQVEHSFTSVPAGDGHRGSSPTKPLSRE